MYNNTFEDIFKCLCKAINVNLGFIVWHTSTIQAAATVYNLDLQGSNPKAICAF